MRQSLTLLMPHHSGNLRDVPFQEIRHFSIRNIEEMFSDDMI